MFQCRLFLFHRSLKPVRMTQFDENEEKGGNNCDAFHTYLFFFFIIVVILYNFVEFF